MNWKNILLKFTPFLSISMVVIAAILALFCGRTHFVQAVSANTLLLILTVSLAMVVFLGWFQRKNEEKTGLSIIISGLLLAIFWIWQFIHLYKYLRGKEPLTEDPQKIEYDGFVGLLFTGVGIILTFIAFYIQYAANQQHSKNFKETRLDNLRARFENTYFDALKSMKELVASQNINGIGNGLEVYRYMFWEYKAMINIVKKVIGEDERKEIIAFYCFLNGVSLAPHSNSTLYKCLEQHINVKFINKIMELVNKVQAIDTTQETNVENAIKEGLFDGIRDYAWSSCINQKRVMWFDGHRHRLLPYIKLRLYITGILETDEFINPLCKTPEETQLRAERRKRYELYFKASFTEYEEKLVNSFLLWQKNLNDKEWEILGMQKEDYLKG